MTSETTHKPHILVVDDEEELLELITHGMNLIGAEVIRADNGLTAWELFQENSTVIDAVISDIFMPKMNGIELLNRIKNLNPETPVILITGYASEVKLEEECQIMPDSYIEKPFSLFQLFEVIQKFLPTKLNIPG